MLGDTTKPSLGWVTAILPKRSIIVNGPFEDTDPSFTRWAIFISEDEIPSKVSWADPRAYWVSLVFKEAAGALEIGPVSTLVNNFAKLDL